MRIKLFSVARALALGVLLLPVSGCIGCGGGSGSGGQNTSVGATGNGNGTGNGGQSSGGNAPVQNSTPIDVATVYNAYRMDETAANAKYLNKTFLLQGTVSGMFSIDAPFASARFEDDSGVFALAAFPPPNGLNTVTIGQTIQFTGTVKGFQTGFRNILIEDAHLSK